jgi:hypothetical protein
MKIYAGSSPKYNVFLVAGLLLEDAVELHPQHLTTRELSLRIVVDPNDSKEIDTAAQAIRYLKESGLVECKNDSKVVKPTLTARRAVVLLTR